MKLSEYRDRAITDADVDRILFEGLETELSRADAAIVLGSSKAHLYRLPPVIEAYKQGRVKRIVCSGRTRELDGRTVNEGELLRDTALAAGVSGEDLLAETQAQNTWENLRFSRALLQREGWLSPGMTVAVATSSYHMRRSLCIAERVFAQDGVRLVPLPGEDSSTTRDCWFTNEKGRSRCYGEVSRLLWAVGQGLIDDREL